MTQSTITTQPSELLAMMGKTEQLVLAAQPTEQARVVLSDGRTFIYHGGKAFEDKPSAPDRLRLSTLASLVDYILSDKDRCVLDKATTILIDNPRSVILLTDNIPPYMDRHALALISPTLPETFDFGAFMSTEKFVIAIQSKFVHSHDYEIVSKSCAGIKRKDGAEYSDSGIAQTVTVKSGISLAKDVQIPNPVTLAPYRTFPEIEQTPSAFTLRLRDGNDGMPEIGLFEADGGMWRVQCTQSIKEWLDERLKGSGLLVLA